MSVHISSHVWRLSAPDASTKLILLKLADHANDDGVGWPSLSRIVRETGLSRPTVRKKLSELEALGWLDRSRDDRENQQSTVYRLHLPPIDENGNPAGPEKGGKPLTPGGQATYPGGASHLPRGGKPLTPGGANSERPLYREPSVQPSEEPGPVGGDASGDLFSGSSSTKPTKVEAVMAAFAGGCPEALADPAIADFLRSWLEIRREKRAALGDAWARQATRKLQRHTVEEIRAAAEASATNGWTGIFPKATQSESQEPETSHDWKDF